MRIIETDQSESIGAGEPENISLRVEGTSRKRLRKLPATPVDVARKSKDPKSADTKTDTVLKKLRLAKGATVVPGEPIEAAHQAGQFPLLARRRGSFFEIGDEGTAFHFLIGDRLLEIEAVSDFRHLGVQPLQLKPATVSPRHAPLGVPLQRIHHRRIDFGIPASIFESVPEAMEIVLISLHTSRFDEACEEL